MNDIPRFRAMKSIKHPLFSLPQRLGGLLLGIFLLQILYGQDASYNVVLSRNPAPLGESTTLQLRYNNCEPDQPPEIPKIDGLTITYAGPSRSRNIQFINGRSTESNLTRSSASSARSSSRSADSASISRRIAISSSLRRLRSRMSRIASA